MSDLECEKIALSFPFSVQQESNTVSHEVIQEAINLVDMALSYIKELEEIKTEISDKKATIIDFAIDVIMSNFIKDCLRAGFNN